jgi:hypothetical protein
MRMVMWWRYDRRSLLVWRSRWSQQQRQRAHQASDPPGGGPGSRGEPSSSVNIISKRHSNFYFWLTESIFLCPPTNHCIVAEPSNDILAGMLHVAFCGDLLPFESSSRGGIPSMSTMSCSSTLCRAGSSAWSALPAAGRLPRRLWYQNSECPNTQRNDTYKEMR